MTIDVYDGDRLIATAVAERFRQDLLSARKGNGRHGFAEPTPAAVKDGRPHAIRAQVKGTTFSLRPLERAVASLTCSK